MVVYPTIDQRSPEWRKLRQGRPTASRFSEIVTAAKGEYSKSAQGYMYELLADCFPTDIDPDEADRFDNFWTRRGTDLEPLARVELAKILQCEIHQVGFCLHDDGLFGCSPDGLIKEGETYIEGVEIKCPSPAVHVEYMAGGKLPSSYCQQVHGSLVITNLPRWHFASFCPGMQAFHVVVERDDYTDKVAACLKKFSEEYKAMREALIPKLQLSLN